MHKELQTLVSVYTRYIDSLKEEGADIKENHKKMRKYINEHSPIWLKGHILQDCYINCLRAYHKKPLETSSIIKELINTNCSDERVSKAEMQLTIKTNDGNGNEQIEYRNSWLPTLYKYFRPSNEEELEYMTVELEKMNDSGIISPSDFWAVRSLVLNAVRHTKNYINNEQSNKPLKIEVIDGEKFLKNIEEEELEEALCSR